MHELSHHEQIKSGHPNKQRHGARSAYHDPEKDRSSEGMQIVASWVEVQLVGVRTQLLLWHSQMLGRCVSLSSIRGKLQEQRAVGDPHI